MGALSVIRCEDASDDRPETIDVPIKDSLRESRASEVFRGISEARIPTRECALSDMTMEQTMQARHFGPIEITTLVAD